jgi:phosphopantothenoylcysteine decarboxylase / phosphopantothenate---cysteine ligase
MRKPLLILTGVSGGVAAYKTVELVSSLRKAGHEVHVAMSPAATQFVTPLTFAAVSGRRVLDQLWPETNRGELKDLYPHLYPATECDVFILAPATADMIAQIAIGLGKDAVSTSALSLPKRCSKFFAPAMNVEMWEQDAVQANVRKLESMGWTRIGPESGHLACGAEGCGRMSEARDILTVLQGTVDNRAALAGKKVLILSGPTREHFDPIRFIGNPSSGKMGKAIAEEARLMGADIDFVTGPVADANLPAAGSDLRLHPVVSAQDMLAAAEKLFDAADAIVYVAAVADYAPAQYYADKLPKQTGDITLKFKATPDIAATLCARKRPDQVAIGFALQTDDGEAAAQGKLKKKNLDAIVLNYTDALGGDSGTYFFISRMDSASGLQEWGKLNKRACAQRIMNAVKVGHSSEA